MLPPCIGSPPLLPPNQILRSPLPHVFNTCGKLWELQSGPDTFDESRFVMTFLTILGETEILCSFRLVLEGKMGKEIPESSRLEFSEKFLANNFALSDAEDSTSRMFQVSRRQHQECSCIDY